MEKIILRLSTLMIFVCLLVCGACSNEDVYRGEQTTSLSAEQKKTVLDAITVDGEIDIFPDKNPKFSQLQQDELMYAFHLIAEAFAEDKPLSDSGTVKKQEYYDYFFALSLSFHELAQELYDKPYNHLTNDEFLHLLDDEFSELTKRAMKYAKTTMGQTLLERISSDEPFVQGPVSYRSTSSCPGNSYPIKTTIASSGSVNCIGYSSATYAGDSDCDYEFTFNWQKPYSPTTLALATTSWRVGKILEKGGIRGRLHANRSGTPPNLVSFLIGAIRIRVAYPMDGPEGLKENLKGSW